MSYIGIDLGTTNSLCCVWQQGRSVLVPNSLGEFITPSAVSLDGNGTVLTGAIAKERLVTHPQLSAHNFKRLMGTEALVPLGGQSFSPEQLSSFLLRRLKEDAERFLGQMVEEAVISVPAYFNDDQRCATKAAARLAGLHVERLVNEPSAAALAYRQVDGGGDQSYLVFDFGGGTLDVSLVDCFDNVVEIVAVAGDNRLGGTDLDMLLAEHFCEYHALDWKALPPAAQGSLLQAAENCKKALSAQEQVAMSLHHNGVYTMLLNQQSLARLAIPWLERCVAPVERVLRDAGRTFEGIDDILLVGGSCKMPLVQQYVRYRCGKEALQTDGPDTLVARGVGVYAGIKSRNESLREMMLTDVCPFTLGTNVDAKGDTVIFPMIERNSVLPCSVEHLFCTARSFQTQIDVCVYQGEGRHPNDNLYLGKVTVFVPPAPVGEEAVWVRFTYDINGILMVDVRHEKTGQVQHLTLLGKRVHFTEQEWEEKCRELEAIKLHPLEQEENQLLLSWGGRLYQETVGDLRMWLGEALEELLQALESQEQHRISKSKRVAKALFRTVEAQRFTLGEVDLENLLFYDGEV